MNTQTSRPRDRFATTRWSMVMRRAAAESGEARDALGELARRYWYPVYVYVRRCGHAPAAAENIARGFLRRLPGDAGAGGAAAVAGPYRNYLLSRLHSYLATNPQDEPGGSLDVPADLELRYQRDHLGESSPERSYQRAFALQIMHAASTRLRSEARQTGHLDMFEGLEPFLMREAAPGEYEFVATQLRLRPLTVVVAMKRLRQRFREIAAEELVDTVTSADDLVAEQDALLAILSEPAP